MKLRHHRKNRQAVSRDRVRLRTRLAKSSIWPICPIDETSNKSMAMSIYKAHMKMKFYLNAKYGTFGIRSKLYIPSFTP